MKTVSNFWNDVMLCVMTLCSQVDGYQHFGGR